MKAILVINVPEDFDYRRCSMGGDKNIYYEREDEQRTSIIGNIKNLKPMPEKKNEKDVEKIYSITDRSWTNGFSDGYNYCIDEILGEE